MKPCTTWPQNSKSVLIVCVYTYAVQPGAYYMTKNTDFTDTVSAAQCDNQKAQQFLRCYADSADVCPNTPDTATDSTMIPFM